MLFWFALCARLFPITYCLPSNKGQLIFCCYAQVWFIPPKTNLSILSLATLVDSNPHPINPTTGCFCNKFEMSFSIMVTRHNVTLIQNHHIGILPNNYIESFAFWLREKSSTHLSNQYFPTACASNAVWYIHQPCQTNHPDKPLPTSDFPRLLHSYLFLKATGNINRTVNRLQTMKDKNTEAKATVICLSQSLMSFGMVGDTCGDNALHHFSYTLIL